MAKISAGVSVAAVGIVELVRWLSSRGGGGVGEQRFDSSSVSTTPCREVGEAEEFDPILNLAVDPQRRLRMGLAAVDATPDDLLILDDSEDQLVRGAVSAYSVADTVALRQIIANRGVLQVGHRAVKNQAKDYGSLALVQVFAVCVGRQCVPVFPYVILPSRACGKAWAPHRPRGSRAGQQATALVVPVKHFSERFLK